MKKYIKILFRSFSIIALLLALSCQDDDAFLAEVSIDSVNPEAAYPLDLVQIQGANFDYVQFIFVGDAQANWELTDGVITMEIPANAPIGNVPLTFAMKDNYRIKSSIEVILRPIPVIQRITPSAAAEGETVTLIGTSLDNVESVTIGEVEATVDPSSTASELKFVVPGGLPNNTASTIKVTTQGGETESESIFYVGQNLLANGEMELGSGDDFDSWDKFNGAELLTATTNPNEAYVGRALRAVGAGADAWRTQFASAPVPTDVGTEYTVYMWIKGETGGTMRFSTTPEALYGGDLEITTEWQQVEYVFTANVDETRIVLDMGVVADAVYFVDNITMIATGAAGPQPVELLLNGGFELGSGDDFDNWNKFNGADLLTQTTNADEVRSGNRALRAVGAGADAWRTQMASDVFATEVGTEYIFSYWIKAEAGSPGDGGLVRMSTAGNGDAQYQGSVTITTEWQKIEWNVTANGTETQLVLDLGATADAVYFIDDVSVLAPPEVPNENILLNSSLEDGDGDDFTNWNKFNGADLLTATTEADQVHSGSRALRAVGAGADAWRTQFASDVVATEVDVVYTASLWIKGEAGTPGDGGSIRMSTAGNGDAQYQGDVTVTTDWQLVEWEITANGTETQIVLDLGVTEDAVYFVDDIELVEN